MSAISVCKYSQGYFKNLLNINEIKQTYSKSEEEV